jgi:hypothetical protein
MTLHVHIIPAWCSFCTAVTEHLLASCTLTCPHCSTSRVMEESMPVLAALVVAEIDGSSSDFHGGE